MLIIACRSAIISLGHNPFTKASSKSFSAFAQNLLSSKPLVHRDSLAYSLSLSFKQINKNTKKIGKNKTKYKINFCLKYCACIFL